MSPPSEGLQAVLLQAVIYPHNITNNISQNTGLVKVTGVDSMGAFQLPYNYPNGSAVMFGDPDLGYPYSLYPNWTAVNNDDGTANFSLNGRRLYYNSTIMLGPVDISQNLSLVSITTGINNNTSRTELLGWLTMVLDARDIISIIRSPEGLQETGEILLIGPDKIDNLYPGDVNNYTAKQVADSTVTFVFPPQSNDTLDNRHGKRAFGGGNPSLPFPARQYSDVVDALTKNNHAINNAGADLSTKNEEGITVSTGYSTVPISLVDWVLVFEISHKEVFAPIRHLRDVVLACVFGTTGILVLLMFPLAHYSVSPIRALRAATQKTVMPYMPDTPHSSSTASGIDRITSEDEDQFYARQEAKKEGFFEKLGLRKKSSSKRPSRALPADSQSSTHRRGFGIPGKVPEKKHWIHDELTDLTSTYNMMSEELTMQYERLEERVKERTAELEHAKQAAEVANESKTLFIANISHELKTPLNGILGLCAVCMQEDDISKLRGMLSTIYKSGDLLLHLLTDLLTIQQESNRAATTNR